MKIFFKRLLIIFSLVLLILLAGLALVAGLFKDKIGATIVQTVNQQLVSELSVQEFDLSIFRNFPNLSAELNGVRLKGTTEEPLLEAETIRFKIGLFSVFKSDIAIQSVVVQGGALRILIDEKGKGNYNIFKAQTDTDESERATQIALSKASLKDIHIEYTDRSQDLAVQTMIEDAAFSGAFSSKAFKLKSEAVLFSEFADIAAVRYLPSTPIEYNVEMAVDLEEKTYAIKQGALEVDGNRFQLDGVVELWDTGTYVDLFASSDEGSLSGVLALLPEKYAEELKGLSSKGRFAFNAMLKGQYNKKQSPEIRVEFSLEDGGLEIDLLEKPLKDVSLEAVFTNGKYRNAKSSSFRLEQFKGYFNRELIELKAEIENFDDPEIDFFVDGVLPLESAYGLLGDPNITDGSGEVELKGVEIKGRYKDIINPRRISSVAASGILEFDDAGLVIGEESLVLDRGTLELEGNRLSIEGLRLEGAGSDVVFEGHAYNLLPVLFADEGNSRHAALAFDARLNAPNLDIDRLIDAFSIDEEAKEEPLAVRDSLVEAHKAHQSRFFGFLDGTFDAQIEALNYKEIEGSDFAGQLSFESKSMKVLGAIEAFGGRVDLDGHVALEAAPVLTAKLTAEHLDVETLFRQTENFGQDVLTHKHLQGQLESKVVIYAYWNEQGAFLMDKLRVLAGIGISDGTLKDFEMLESFSDFVHVRDLREIQFVNIQNFLEIRNERLYLPVMFIRSNALNLTISGEHSFENEIAYCFKVNAGQVIADRFRKHNPSLIPKPARQSGFFNLYYSMLGTLDDYNIAADKKRVQDDFKHSDFRKREVQRALEKEFGIVELIQEPESWKDIPEYDHGVYESGEEEYLDFEVGGR
ncbi:MAG: AsmA family protein [Phaeodactylibacter sp.]|nr:AsmA family protein [Phaeodactylibacter sp.]